MVALPGCVGNIDPMDPQAFPDDAPDSSTPTASEDASIPDDVATDPELDDEVAVATEALRRKKRDAGTPTSPTVDAGTTADAGTAPPPAAPPPATGSVGADGVWTKLSVLQVVNPLQFGASGSGVLDDTNALNSAVNALPASGGIVYFPAGKTFKKTNLLTITKSHVKLWTENRGAEIFQSIAGQRRHQSILCRNNTGCGVFGLKLRSDATQRFDALEDNQISGDHASAIEVVGNEVNGSAATGIFFLAATELYIEGNYVHHTWADHIHHTDGTKTSWVWGNTMFNQAPSKGDDGIACVTYGVDSPRCQDMEWWNNKILHTDWGRGYSVIGGTNILIHDNWAIGVAGAGVIVASEPSYNTSASSNISVTRNYVANCGHTIGHPGLLVSGMNNTAGPLKDIAMNSNVVVNVPAGPYRVEGTTSNVTNVGMSTATSALPAMPSTSNIVMADTRVLRTRDTSFAPADTRAGLYRIHVRRAPDGVSFQQRFEYVVKGPQDAVTAFVQQRVNAKDYLSEQRTEGGVTYAVLLTAAPVAIPSTLTGVAFREMRVAERDGKLTWLWQRVDSGNY
jgi:hypothetical protein